MLKNLDQVYYGMYEFLKIISLLQKWKWNKTYSMNFFDKYSVCLTPPPTPPKKNQERKHILEQEKGMWHREAV